MVLAELVHPMAASPSALQGAMRLYGFTAAQTEVFLIELHASGHISDPGLASERSDSCPSLLAEGVPAILTTIEMHAGRCDMQLQIPRGVATSRAFYQAHQPARHGAITPQGMSTHSLRYPIAEFEPGPALLYWLIVRSFLNLALVPAGSPLALERIN